MQYQVRTFFYYLKRCCLSNFGTNSKPCYIVVRAIHGRAIRGLAVFLLNIIQNTIVTKPPTRDENVLDDEPTNQLNRIDCVEMVDMAPESIVVTKDNGECMIYFLFCLIHYLEKKRIHFIAESIRIGLLICCFLLVYRPQALYRCSWPLEMLFVVLFCCCCQTFHDFVGHNSFRDF